ncbi:translation factor SUA5 [Mariprofundus ferrinatatus]|uniref:L-threonylcarbamoyladenylate synthase n=1 Tax=Mariprofundus ferrinatatus TaxID=1921087 RepID=A0A2K8L1G4_9PROT|nr:Sua5/YciO/YrdC/YwlC family protein [Mariprofundus ferrinatatus]ATX80922.1 translation factor SUA5 [Mariprofundus ferrinatatus]
MLRRQRRSSRKTEGRARTKDKLAALRAATILNRGGAIAHYTHTLPGAAANPRIPASVARLINFKQRKGPFLLLADSVKTAAGLIRYYSPELRRIIRDSWPGPYTLVVPAKPGLTPVCYRGGMAAIRVDASLQTRQLASACGGLLLSSSLNRRGRTTADVNRKVRMRWHSYLSAALPGPVSSGKASVLLRVWRNDSTIIRP